MRPIDRWTGPATVWHTALALLFIAVATSPSAAGAQVVVGSVTGEDEGGPVRGAIVHVETRDGLRIASGLTGGNGRFVLRAGSPGTYRLYVEMIGYGPVSTEFFQVDAGATIERAIRVAIEPVVLAGIRAESTRRCATAREAQGDLARLWDEARKGLHAVVLTEAAPRVMFRTAVVERDLDVRTGEVLSEVVHPRRVLRAYPFRAPNAANLLSDGFVQVSRDTTVFIAPDANLLLSDEFLREYCFGIERAAGAAEVGLTFAPVRRRGGPPSITGTLWLDEETAGLRRIEYRYNPTSVFPEARQAGGTMTFEQLANGAWIIRDWRIHAPRFTMHMPQARLELQSIKETTGRVVEVRGLDAGP